MQHPDDLSRELQRVQAEVEELEAQLDARRAWAEEAQALGEHLRRHRLRLKSQEWGHEARVAALAASSTLIIAGAFALDPSLGAVGTASSFALLIWEAVK